MMINRGLPWQFGRDAAAKSAVTTGPAMSQPISRRTFLAGSLGLAAGALPVSTASPISMKSNHPKLVHHVFFWLKNPQSRDDLNRLLAGIRTLEAIETVRSVHLGVPASTEKREVVDNSFSASELLFFDDIEAQNTYQSHPIHQKFVQDCSHLWSRVVVYDAISA